MAIVGMKELFARSDASGSKSTVLKPLTWFLSLIIGGLLFLLKFEAPNWIIVLFSIIISISILFFFFAYIYCLFYDRDALRSESYSIQKMAIEKGVIGDNVTGVLNNLNSIGTGKIDVSNQSEEGN